jgi:hypothetical protein
MYPPPTADANIPASYGQPPGGRSGSDGGRGGAGGNLSPSGVGGYGPPGALMGSSYLLQDVTHPTPLVLLRVLQVVASPAAWAHPTPPA